MGGTCAQDLFIHVTYFPCITRAHKTFQLYSFPLVFLGELYVAVMSFVTRFPNTLQIHLTWRLCAWPLF